MTYQEIKEYANILGFTFSDEDCQELLDSSYEGETLAQAVNDYLDAYER